jgi:flavodoxin
MRQLLLIILGLLLCCCTSDKDPKDEPTQSNEIGKTLVVYYSYTGNSHEIVKTLTSQIKADVMRIEPADKTQKYEANNYAIGTALLNAIKAAPNDAASYPAIDPVSITDLSQYQNIIIVTPLWWSQMAAITQTYLFNYGAQMAGKHVALIVSSHSSGISGVVSDAKRLVKNVTWMGDALWINASNHSNRSSLIENWLKTLTFAQSST